MKIKLNILIYFLLINNLFAYLDNEFIDTKCNLYLSSDVVFTKDINNSTLQKLNITRIEKEVLIESEGYIEKVYFVYYEKNNKYLFHTEQNLNSRNISLIIGNSSDIYLKTKHLNINIGDSLKTILKIYPINSLSNGEEFAYVYLKGIDKIGLVIPYREYGSEANINKVIIEEFFCPYFFVDSTIKWF